MCAVHLNSKMFLVSEMAGMKDGVPPSLKMHMT